jgi:hypothetical protein
MVRKLCKVFHLVRVEKGDTGVAVPRGEWEGGGEWRNYFMASINFEDLVVCSGDKCAKLWLGCTAPLIVPAPKLRRSVGFFRRVSNRLILRHMYLFYFYYSTHVRIDTKPHVLSVSVRVSLSLSFQPEVRQYTCFSYLVTLDEF